MAGLRLGFVAVVAASLLGAGPVVAERLLVLTATAGYRHESIPATVEAIEDLARPLGLVVERLDGPVPLPRLPLEGVVAVVLAQTTGDFLGNEAAAALESFVRGGGGLLAVHAAADAHYGWPAFEELVGAWFRAHPPGLQTTLVRFAPDLPGLEALGGGRDWWVTDELYDFRSNPRGRVQVIATIDERTYEGGGMGADHPIAWCHKVGRGRSWYTGLGHRAELFADPVMREHLSRGLAWVIGRGRTC